jgi:hypothetical protein
VDLIYAKADIDADTRTIGFDACAGKPMLSLSARCHGHDVAYDDHDPSRRAVPAAALSSYEPSVPLLVLILLSPAPVSSSFVPSLVAQLGLSIKLCPKRYPFDLLHLNECFSL